MTDTPWPNVLHCLRELAPFASLREVVAQAQELRPGVTYTALKSACQRHVEWRPMGLVGEGLPTDSGDTTSEDWWEGEDTDIDVSPEPMQPNVRIDAPRMTLFPGDIHCPIWDRELVFSVLDFADSIGVDHLCIGGDLLDVYGASRFSKEAHRLMADHGRMVAELRAVTGFYHRCSQIFDRIDWLLGNHEARAAERFVNENMWLYQHPAMDPRALFEVPDRWHLYEAGTRLRAGSVCFAHGHRLKGSGAQHSAANVLKWNAYQHTVYGHTHRVQQAGHAIYDQRGLPVTYTATSAGHLSQLKYHKDYATQPNWCHGFVLVEHGKHPQVHDVRINDRRWLWMGREYGVGC